EEHVHAGALVEVCRAGRVLGVDAEGDGSLAAVPKLRESMVQEGKPEASPPPRLAHADSCYPTGFEAPSVTHHCCGDLVFIPDAHPEVERCARGVHSLPTEFVE